MSITKGTQDTLLDRAVSAATEAIMEADSSASWLRDVVQTVILNAAAELIALEELEHQPLTLQNAVKFLCDGAEGKA